MDNNFFDSFEDDDPLADIAADAFSLEDEDEDEDSLNLEDDIFGDDDM